VDVTDQVMRLRPFVRADDDEVSSWFEDAGQLRFFAGRRLKWPLDEQQWENIRLDSSVTAWTAVYGDDPVPVGHGELIRESAQLVRFARIALSPTLRGQGLGRVFGDLMIEKAREHGFERASLWVNPGNEPAIRAYRTLGFEPVTLPGADGNLRMERPLDE
jgi:GNAT superfamily N-acetyltransferase